MSSAVKYVEADEVADLVRQGSETLVIIDVRDEDEVWHDGQIKGPVLHIPSTRFSSLANAKDIIRDHDLLAKGIIAVHCHKSQQRGPYCARFWPQRPASWRRSPPRRYMFFATDTKGSTGDSPAPRRGNH